MSSGTMPTSKSPQLSPSGFMNNLRMGLVRITHHILTTWMEPWDFESRLEGGGVNRQSTLKLT
jgi:hypothetical protein